jgi:hypothetical protein
LEWKKMISMQKLKRQKLKRTLLPKSLKRKQSPLHCRCPKNGNSRHQNLPPDTQWCQPEMFEVGKVHREKTTAQVTEKSPNKKRKKDTPRVSPAPAFLR